jgi:hypothetical protein
MKSLEQVSGYVLHSQGFLRDSKGPFVQAREYLALETEAVRLQNENSELRLRLAQLSVLYVDAILSRK